MSQFRIVSTVSATVLLAGAISFSLAGTAAAQNQLNCADFSTQQQAQAQLNQDPSDPNRLDADHDGIACESLPSGATGSNGTQGSNGSSGAQTPSNDTGSSGGQSNANQGQVSSVPRGGVDTGDGSTGSNGMAFILGGIALTVAGGGVGVAARRRVRAGA